MTSASPAEKRKGTLASKIVVVMIVVMAIVVTIGAATTLPARLEVRGLIRDLGSPDLAKATAALDRLERIEPRRLRPEHSAFLAALGAYAPRREKLFTPRSNRVQDFLTNLAKVDPALVMPARSSPTLSPYAKEALRRAGRPDLANPPPH